MPSTESVNKASIAFEGFVLDMQRHGLYRADERIHLTPIPFKVLEFLVQQRDSVVSKEQLLNAVWGGHREENTVEQAIRQIRRALGEDKEQPRFIRTIPGVGYCFIATVTEIDESEPNSNDIPQEEAPISTIRAATKTPGVFITALVAVALAACCSLLVIVFLRQPPYLAAVNPTTLTQSQALILSPLLSDGAQIYYPRYENGQYSVGTAQIEQGTHSVFATGLPNPELCDLNADGSAMLLRNLIHSRDSENPLYVLHKGGKAQRVGHILAFDAAWIPHQKTILYSANGVIYTTDTIGHHIQRRFSVPGNAYWFRWSPDGKELRFTVLNKKDEALSLWQIDAGSDSPHRLFKRLGHYVCCGTWTPDGRFFLFQVRSGGTYQIWAQPTRRGGLFASRPRPYPLVFGAVSYRSPLVSKNGNKLFLRDSEPRGELVRYDAKSAGFIPLLPSISVRTPNFSRTGNWIAFANPTDNNLWRCRSNGSQCIPLTQKLRSTLMPRWSPNGHRIAFMGVTYSGRWQIYVVPAKGGPPHSVYKGKQAEGYPDWSPHGQRLAFSEVVPVAKPDGIHILNLRTSKVSTLPGSTDFYLPRWSPNGRFLVALHSGNRYLYSYSFATKTWQPLVKMPVGYPAWSRIGREVYFESNSSGNRIVYRVDMADRVVQKVVSLQSVNPSPSIMGDWVGLAPNGAPLAVQSMNTDNIYSWNLVVK